MYHGHGFRCSLKHDDGASLTVPTAIEKEWQASNSEVSSGTKESVGRELPIVLRPVWTGVQRAFAVGKLVVRLQSSSWPAFLAEALLILLGLSGCMQVRFPGRARLVANLVDGPRPAVSAVHVHSGIFPCPNTCRRARRRCRAVA